MRKSEFAYLLLPSLLLLIEVAVWFAPPNRAEDGNSSSDIRLSQSQLGSPALAESGIRPADDSPPKAELLARHFYRVPISRAPAALPPPLVEEPKPEPAAPRAVEWIRHLGLVAEGERMRFFFKDLRSNRVIALAEGERNGEWLLERLDGKDFVLEVEGERYRVSSSPR